MNCDLVVENHQHVSKRHHAHASACEIPAENPTKSAPPIQTVKTTAQDDDSIGWKVQKGKFKRRVRNTVIGSANVDPEINFAALQVKKA